MYACISWTISFPYNKQSSCHCYRYSIDWQCHLLCFYWLTYTSKPSYSLAQSLLLSWTTLWRSDICCSNCGCVLTIFAFCSGATTVYGILTFHSVNSALTSWFASLIDVDVTVVYKRPWGSGKQSSWPLAIFQPTFTIWLNKSNLLGQIYCTFPMEKPLIVYWNAPAFKECPTNFKLFRALGKLLSCMAYINSACHTVVAIEHPCC